MCIRWGWMVTCIGLIFGMAVAEVAVAEDLPGETPSPTTLPTTQPAADPMGRAVAELWIPRLVDAMNSASLPSLQADLDSAIQTELEKGDALNRAALVRLATYRQFAEYFGRIAEPSDAQSQTLAWLIEQETLLSTLMMAVSAADAPDPVLEVLSRLRTDEPKYAAGYPELVTALCVVWDERDQPSDQDPTVIVPEPMLARAVYLLRYYVRAGDRLQFDVRSMPYELSVFVIDARASEGEMLWAAQRYLRHGAVGRTYFDVTYDSAFLAGMPKRIEGMAYTLPNLLQAGGICSDQAYFASEVAKAVGVPSVECDGAAGIGGGFHAWVGYLQAVGKDVRWNFREGRYREHDYWWGHVVHPQTQERIFDAEVALTMESASLSWDRRMTSAALTRSVDLAQPSEAMRLLATAIELNPGNRTAWLALAEMGAQGELNAGQIERVMRVVDRFATRDYPEFAWVVLLKVVSGRDTAEQVAALDRLVGVFRHRPDLQARTRLVQGDLLASSHPRRALECYFNVAENSVELAPVTMMAMERIDGLLRSHGELARLMGAYDAVWKRMPQPPSSGLAVVGSPWGLVGRRYQMLADELGDFQTSAAIQRRLNTAMPAASQR